MSRDYTLLKGDIFGGLTAGIIALPLTLAFGVEAFAQVEELSPNFDHQALSVIGAKAGLYGAMFLCMFTAIFGGTNTQISGPTAPMTVLSKTVIFSAFSAVFMTMSNPELATIDDVFRLALPVILVTFILAGIFQMGFGLIKIGKLIEYIPYSVVSGFMSGISSPHSLTRFTRPNQLLGPGIGCFDLNHHLRFAQVDEGCAEFIGRIGCRYAYGHLFDSYRIRQRNR
jgi:SulP family sulfate permease